MYSSAWDLKRKYVSNLNLHWRHMCDLLPTCSSYILRCTSRCIYSVYILWAYQRCRYTWTTNFYHSVCSRFVISHSRCLEQWLKMSKQAAPTGLHVKINWQDAVQLNNYRTYTRVVSKFAFLSDYKPKYSRGFLRIIANTRHCTLQ